LLLDTLFRPLPLPRHRVIPNQNVARSYPQSTGPTVRRHDALTNPPAQRPGRHAGLGSGLGDAAQPRIRGVRSGPLLVFLYQGVLDKTIHDLPALFFVGVVNILHRIPFPHPSNLWQRESNCNMTWTLRGPSRCFAIFTFTSFTGLSLLESG